jgi:hypothetical protein
LASSKLHRIGLKFGRFIGDEEKCALSDVMGDNERMMSTDAFSMVSCGFGAVDEFLVS